MATTTKPRSIKGEAKVRDYLVYLNDPQSIIKPAAVAKAQKALDNCTDPLQALGLFQDLEIARTPDGTTLEEAFIAAAFDYAAVKGYSPDTFIAQGVHRDVLRAAGFQVRAGSYKGRVTGADVQAHILTRQGVFTIAQVAQDTLASLAGARNSINEMIAEGTVDELEPLRDGTPGKPSKRYQVSK